MLDFPIGLWILEEKRNSFIYFCVALHLIMHWHLHHLNAWHLLGAKHSAGPLVELQLLWVNAGGEVSRLKVREGP